MALIKITGGSDGIMKYLEDGLKEGRYFTRDQLDHRVILAGNYDATNQTIQILDPASERYQHITIGFKEDYIPDDVLLNIVEDFKIFAFAAFGSDEYSFYAEAHIPKIASLPNNKTRKPFERKPHLHIVVPNVNLITINEKKPRGNKLGLFGSVKQQIDFIDAFQEHINNKYGLASPKDHPRFKFTNAADMLSRYKGDMFKTQERVFRKSIHAAVIAQKIETYDDFKKLVSTFGTVEVMGGRNKGCFKVRVPGAKDFIRLDDNAFKREFIELSTAKKERLFNAKYQAEYIIAETAKKDPQYITEKLREWHEIRANEIKYLNSGNTKAYGEYKAAKRDEKLTILASREARFYNKHKGLDHEQNRNNAKSIGREPPPFARGRVRNLSELDVVRLADRSEMLLQGDVRDHVEHSRAEQAGAMRWPDDRVERPADNVIGQYQAEAQTEKIRQQTEVLSEFQEIKRNLDARWLLAYLSKTHGVIPEKYEVNKGNDGSDRIKCGNRNLNVSDFLTIERRLPWAEAAPILRECYAAQLAHEPTHEIRKEPKHSALWQDFQGWKVEHVAHKSQAWEQQKTSELARLSESRQIFQKEKARINAAAGNKHAERRASVSIARMDKVQADKALSEQIKAERLALKTTYTMKASELFRVFLQQRAQAGDELALAELRRQRIEPLQRDDQAKQFTAGAAPETEQHRRGEDPIAQGEKITHRVALNGDVTYQFNGRDVLRDEPRAVKILDDNDREVLETGLRLALQKFGPKIQARGDEDFQRRIVEVSVDAGLKVEFTNPLLNEYRHQLEVEKRATIEQTKAARTQQPKQKEKLMDQPTVSPGKTSSVEQQRHEENRRYEEALQRAKDADLPAWLLDRGIKIEKNGTTSWKFSHGSGDTDRIFKSQHGNWMVHSSHGDREYMDAIAYAQMHIGITHRQAVEELSGIQLSATAYGQPTTVAASTRKAQEKGARPNPVATAIKLHEATKQQRANAYQYALSRGISDDTLREAGEQNVIKADHRGLVFIGHDKEGKIRSAETRFIKAEKIGDEMTTKMCYASTDKTFPPILRGNDKDVHFVEGGFDALALRDLYKREGKEPPTAIITGGARTLKWQNNSELCDLIKNADHVRPWYDNEMKADGQIDSEKQADTQEAHDRQRDTIIQIRGKAEGVEEMRPPVGIKDIADWNVQHAQEHQAKQQQHEEQEEHRPSMRP